CQSGYGAPYSF
nr:immunoglobulin light chain junction region [Macaca mulatta]MOW52825.1 immunoglobulin light chain junction region [Macaca mulatta]MOW53733.1 immunoglobulin light chain junction region [Macaca mulatta]MOW54625.1 immunoglobulin light chain junction region [Macaca mulatta]MOW55059.1 immunoglobulin light chain junction region [Macaca mulatta]